MTRPDIGPLQFDSIDCAIKADAFPAPITRVLPFGGSGRYGGTQRDGLAAATAVSKSERNVSSGVICSF